MCGHMLAGSAGAIPMAGIAFAVPSAGPPSLHPRWWCGAPARSRVVAALAAITGVGTGALGILALPPLVRLAFVIFAVVGVGLAVVDLRRHRLPHAMTGLLGAECLLFFGADAVVSGSGVAIVRAAVTGVITATVLLCVALALPGQLGLGDVVFAGVVTASLGWLSVQSATLGLLVGFIVQGVVVACRAVWVPDRRRTLPLGPALMVGWMAGVVAGV